MPARTSASSLCSCMLRSGLRAGSSSAEESSRAQAPRAFLHTTRVARLEESASAAAAASIARSAPATSQPSHAAAKPASSSSPRIFASLLVSRPPTLTRTPTAFESAVFDYNAKLHRLLAQPFPKDFYFKRGSSAESKFEELEAERQRTLSFPVPESSKSSKGKGKKAQSTPAAESAGATSEADPDKELYAVLPRRTAADEANDVKSLERAGERTLYLVVKTAQQSGWRFPADVVDSSGKARAADGATAGATRDTLHSAAERSVYSLLGDAMDIWLVTHMPVGLLDLGAQGKTYFLPAHILAGNAEAKTASAKKADFAWLTREEIEESLSNGSSEDKAYWQAVDALLLR